jgi:hypothetical protein
MVVSLSVKAQNGETTLTIALINPNQGLNKSVSGDVLKS